MWKKSLIWQIYPPYMIIIFISLVIVTWYGSNLIRSLYLERIEGSLQVQSTLISQLFVDQLQSQSANTIQSRCQLLRQEIPSRITIILPSGLVIGDTHENPEVMDNHADRPEVRQALEGMVGSSTRFSNTLGEELMYVACPIVQDNKIIGVARTATPVSKLAQVLAVVYQRIILVGLIVGFAAALVSWGFSERINRPVQIMQEGFSRFGAGELDHQIHISKPLEFRLLAESMNSMAKNLQGLINTITQQRNESETILSSMIEGVIVVDPDEKILRINQAAMQILDIPNQDAESARGKRIQELVRNQALQKFIRDSLEMDIQQEEELVLNNLAESTLKLHGVRLKDIDGNSIGALIVLNDVTQMKMLENIRKEFVSNVSHELKTPVTSIKGYVETLRAGAVNDKKNATRFLKIISKHADRLHAIIEDLLNLSRIEQDVNNSHFELEYASVKKVLVDAVSVCYKKAGERKIKIELVFSNRIKAMIKPPLLSLAVVNLLDNAIKYSDENSKVRLEGYIEENEVIISVRDWGCGIPEESMPRIFERFYRVDKARSRDLGGTGLGLAIVKHIVQTHRGYVQVESALEQGSCFKIFLPMIKKEAA